MSESLLRRENAESLPLRDDHRHRRPHRAGRELLHSGESLLVFLEGTMVHSDGSDIDFDAAEHRVHPGPDIPALIP